MVDDFTSNLNRTVNVTFWAFKAHTLRSEGGVGVGSTEDAALEAQSTLAEELAEPLNRVSTMASFAFLDLQRPGVLPPPSLQADASNRLFPTVTHLLLLHVHFTYVFHDFLTGAQPKLAAGSLNNTVKSLRDDG